jgi:hypothetical protein
MLLGTKSQHLPLKRGCDELLPGGITAGKIAL